MSVLITNAAAKGWYRLPHDILISVATYLDDSATTALMRTDKAYQQILLSLIDETGNWMRNSLLRFVKGRVAVYNPHKSERHLRRSELPFLLKATAIDLNLSGIKLPAERVARLVKALPQVRSLNLDDCQMNDRSVRQLLPLRTTLRSLSLLQHSFDPCGITPYVTTNGIAMLRQFFALRSLAIGGYNVRNEQLSTLQDLTQLESLTLFDDKGDKNMSISQEIVTRFAGRMPNLHTLIIQDWDITTQALEALAAFKNLRVLVLTHQARLPEPLIEAPVGLPRSLREVPLIEKIANLKWLKSITLYDSEVARRWGAELYKLRPDMTITLIAKKGPQPARNANQLDSKVQESSLLGSVDSDSDDESAPVENRAVANPGVLGLAASLRAYFIGS